MNQLDEQLRQLVKQACSHPPGSAQRQRNLTQIIRLVSRKLWKEYKPYYQDALQQTWVYFCQNICEGNTGRVYDPDRSSITTWLNVYLKRRLQDFFIDEQKQQVKTVTPKAQNSGSGQSGEILDPIDILPAQPDVPPLLEEVRQWVKTDPELSCIHITNNPKVTCRLLIERRLPPEESWKDLAEEFNLSISTLSSFYQRQCIPRLRKFGESEGYL